MGSHGVVVPGLSAIETNLGGSGDQALVGQAIAGGMGEQGQPPGGPDRRHHRLRPQAWSHHGLALQVGGQGLRIGPESQAQHMHEAALQQAADLDPPPEGGNRVPLLLMTRQGGSDEVMGGQGVVVGHGQVLKADRHRLVGEGLGGQAAIAAKGVAVEVEAGRTALGTHLAQHRRQRMLMRLSPQHRVLPLRST